jgi:hypothetical protein
METAMRPRTAVLAAILGLSACAHGQPGTIDFTDARWACPTRSEAGEASRAVLAEQSPRNPRCEAVQGRYPLLQTGPGLARIDAGERALWVAL